MRTLTVALLLFLVFASTGASKELLVVPPAEWSAPSLPSLGRDALYLQSGALKLGHEKGTFGAFELQVRGKRIAIGPSRPLVGYLQGDSVRWFSVNEASRKKVEIREEGGRLEVFASFVDPAGPWQQLADGITASALQQIWPHSDTERQGLLPDVFNLREQERGGPAINPGTAQVNAARFYRQTPFSLFELCANRVGLSRYRERSRSSASHLPLYDLSPKAGRSGVTFF